MQRQENRNIQRQSARTRLTPQQMLNVQVTEMPINQLEEFVRNQVIENLALEATPSDNADYGSDTPLSSNREEGDDRAVESSSMTYAEDRIPVGNNYSDRPERVFGNTESFLDKLNEQIGEHDLSEKQREIINYLIGSLDDDGLLRKSIVELTDEMTVYENIDVAPEEVADVLKILQSFDPPGIGAQSLQQCLLIQIDRKGKGRIQQLMHTVVANYYDDIKKNHISHIQTALGLDDEEKEQLRAELRRLNPKPGSSLGETQGFSINRIIPDFIVDTDDSGRVTFSLNSGNLPKLSVAPSYEESLSEYQNNPSALSFTKKGIDSARGLISALEQRQRTMTLTMKAIIQWQYRFFQDGDETDLRPMRLKDIADRTGLDISTISRVTNVKYAQTRWGVFPLRFFFVDKYTNENGEELSTKEMKLALKDIIDHEDKKHPLSDIALQREMKARSYDLARRTIAKYRDQMGIPKAILRKE